MISKIKTKLHGLNGEYTLKVECKKVSKETIVECLKGLIFKLEEQ